jgi:hypothetical protein
MKSIATRETSVGSRKRFRLTSRVIPCSSRRMKLHTQLQSSLRQASALGVD